MIIRGILAIIHVNINMIQWFEYQNLTNVTDAQKCRMSTDVCLRCLRESGKVSWKLQKRWVACNYYALCVFAVACRHCHHGGLGRFWVDGLWYIDGWQRVFRYSVTAGPWLEGGRESVKYGDSCCHLRRWKCRQAPCKPNTMWHPFSGGIWVFLQRLPIHLPSLVLPTFFSHIPKCISY